MLIDIYTHIFPARFFEYLMNGSNKLGSLAERLKSVKASVDLDARFRAMDGFGDYRQIITLPHPALEEIAGDPEAARLASLANDGLAELCSKHPDRFPAFVASVSLLNVESAVAEAERAVTQLGARGIQIHTNVLGRPLDDPSFDPIFASYGETRLADLAAPGAHSVCGRLRHRIKLTLRNVVVLRLAV